MLYRLWRASQLVIDSGANAVVTGSCCCDSRLIELTFAWVPMNLKQGVLQGNLPLWSCTDLAPQAMPGGPSRPVPGGTLN